MFYIIHYNVYFVHIATNNDFLKRTYEKSQAEVIEKGKLLHKSLIPPPISNKYINNNGLVKTTITIPSITRQFETKLACFRKVKQLQL